MASYVGFANLPNQVHRKSVRRGFEFTLMVVGKYLISIDMLTWEDYPQLNTLTVSDQQHILGFSSRSYFYLKKT